ncbi:F-box/LRR-repeat protein 15-like [Silene latifolia]|uniref:F-box/LRR-repeat protein 15-like n=1 Tax=Silene latifolia TaxID=37657 RepID=UPI003D76C3E6
MRIWCCLPCFGEFDSGTDNNNNNNNNNMEGDKDAENVDNCDNNRQDQEFGDEIGGRNDDEEDKLGFSLGLNGSSLSNNNNGSSKRDLKGVVVGRETSVDEMLELSMGGSSSRILPSCDAEIGRNVGPVLGSNLVESFVGEAASFEEDVLHSDSQPKRAKLESSLQECHFSTAGLPSADNRFDVIRSYRSSNNNLSVHQSNKIWHLSSSVEEDVNTCSPINVQDTIQGDVDSSSIDGTEIQMDLSDDLLHMVFSFLGHGDLCRAAMVCKQWRVASAREEFWRSLDFENRNISVEQLEDICHRYPRATEVNLCGNPDMNMLAMGAISLLRNLEALAIGKGQLGEAFFHALSDCPLLRKLVVRDAALGNGVQEISINHDRLRHLQVTKCRVLRVSVRCPQLDTLSLKRSNMAHVVLNCPLLHKLNIGSCHKLPDTAIRSAVISCPLLEYLDMSNCSCVSDETLREISSACGNLRKLNASYCPNISLESVRMPLLAVLRLESCEGITSASMTAIAFSNMLEVLELDNCNLLMSVSLELPHLRNLRLVHCRKFVDLDLRCPMLSSLTVSNCPALHSISITSNALKKLALHKQESLNSLSLQCQYLEEVDLADCEALTDTVCGVFSDGGGCPMLKSLVLDNCESLTTVGLHSTSLACLSLAGCRAITSLDLTCPYLEQVRLDGCDHLERASFLPVGLLSLNLGICPKLISLHIEAPCMVGLELKGCGVLSEVSIDCPLLTSLDASFCSQLEDGCLSATATSCLLIEKLILMSCPSIGSDGLSTLCLLKNLTYLDLSYTFLMDLEAVFKSCLSLTVLKLQACKYLHDSSLEALHKEGALPALRELDLSYGTLCQTAIEELLAYCTHLTHISLNGCINMHDLDWGLMAPSSFQACDVASKPVELPHRLLQNLNCVGCPNIKRVFIPSTAQCMYLSSLNLSLSVHLKEVDIACSNLCFLNLSNCSSLDSLRLECPKLTSVFLQSCNIDEETVESAISGCSMLETLDVRFCPKISSGNMSRLRVIHPNLKRIFCSRSPC